MKVSIYKAPDGTLSLLVQPALGKGLPPVMVPVVTRQNIKEVLLPIIRKIRGEPPQSLS